MIKLGIEHPEIVHILEDGVTIFVCRGRDVVYAHVDNILFSFIVVKLSDGSSHEIKCADRAQAGKLVEYAAEKMR